MDLNLDTLKQEIVEHLEHSEFAIFRGASGGLEGLPMVLWDSERFPDYMMFLEAARKAGTKMILFAAREFEASEIDDAIEELDECDLRVKSAAIWKPACAKLRIHGRHLFAGAGLRSSRPHVRVRHPSRLVRRIPEHRRGDRRAPAYGR